MLTHEPIASSRVLHFVVNNSESTRVTCVRCSRNSFTPPCTSPNMPKRQRYTNTHCFEGFHTGKITAVAFNLHGTMLASASVDKSICIYRTATTELAYRISAPSAITSLVWAPQSDTIVLCGTEDGAIFSVAFTKVRHISTQITRHTHWCERTIHIFFFLWQNKLTCSGFHAHSGPVSNLAALDHQFASAANSDVYVWKYTSNGAQTLLLSLPIISITTAVSHRCVVEQEDQEPPAPYGWRTARRKRCRDRTCVDQPSYSAGIVSESRPCVFHLRFVRDST